MSEGRLEREASAEEEEEEEEAGVGGGKGKDGGVDEQGGERERAGVI